METRLKHLRFIHFATITVAGSLLYVYAAARDLPPLEREAETLLRVISQFETPRADLWHVDPAWHRFQKRNFLFLLEEASGWNFRFSRPDAELATAYWVLEQAPVDLSSEDLGTARRRVETLALRVAVLDQLTKGVEGESELSNLLDRCHAEHVPFVNIDWIRVKLTSDTLLGIDVKLRCVDDEGRAPLVTIGTIHLEASPRFVSVDLPETWLSRFPAFSTQWEEAQHIPIDDLIAWSRRRTITDLPKWDTCGVQ